ncbi:MAG: hypothetical protein V4717_14590 [Bacteroidota bacterium]
MPANALVLPTALPVKIAVPASIVVMAVVVVFAAHGLVESPVPRINQVRKVVVWRNNQANYQKGHEVQQGGKKLWFLLAACGVETKMAF